LIAGTDTRPDLPNRIVRLRSAMAERGLDAVVAAGAAPVTHLCGYWRYFGSLPALVVGADGVRTLFVQVDEADEARECRLVDDVATYGSRGFGLVPDPAPLLAEVVAESPVLARATAVGLAADGGTFADALAGRLTASIADVTPVLAAIRRVKDRDELERILAAYELAWTAQGAVRNALRPGISEIELFTAGLEAAQLAAGEPIAFLGDLLSGARSAEVCAPIRVAGRRQVEAGDGVIADLVVGRRGYWGDSAETLVAGVDDEVDDVREQLGAVLDRAAGLLVPGSTGAEVFEAMRADIAARFPGGEFPHHGGHGVGLTPFEDPHVIPGDHTPLEPGMALALEPGVYFAGRFGVRVERMFVVGDEGGIELREALAGLGDGSG
jgi:Xaa-Pro aminopeptidase